MGAQEEVGAGGGGLGPSLIRAKQVCATGQGMVFRVLSLKQGIQFLLFSILNRVFSWTRSL